jgi:spoIIIJ-associated protein
VGAVRGPDRSHRFEDFEEGNSVSDTDVTGTSDDLAEGPSTGAQSASVTTVAVVDDAAATTSADAEDEAADVNDVDVDDEDGDDEDDEDGEDDEDDEDGDDDGDGDDEGRPAGSRRGRRGPSIKRLEEEGDVAADYLEVLLDITDLDGDIDIDVENGRASVAIVAETGTDRQLRRLVGAKGEVLEALQELARLAVQAATGERSRLMLDVAGFRAARRRTLEDVAARACQEVQRGGQPVRLEPLTAFERKVVHDVVAAAGLVSESEGEDPGRRVVIFPAKA